jgi:hypothetical protein
MPKILVSVGSVRFYRNVGTTNKERSAHLLREILSPSPIPPEVAPQVGEQPRLCHSFLTLSRFPYRALGYPEARCHRTGAGVAGG